MATLGYTGTGDSTSSTTTTTTGLEVASPFTASESGTVTKASIYVGAKTVSVGVSVGVAVWADSSALPGALLKDFGETVVGPGQAMGWVDLPGTMSLTGGTIYWIGWYNPSSSDIANVGDLSTGTGGKFKVTSVGPPPKDPFGSPGGNAGGTSSVFLTYTPATSPSNIALTAGQGSFLRLKGIR